MGHMKHAALHFLQKLPQVVVVEGQGTLGKDKEKFTVDDHIGTRKGWFVFLRTSTLCNPLQG